MRLNCHDHRDFSRPNLIFKNGAPKAAAEKFGPEKLKEFEKDFFKGMEPPRLDMTPDELLKFVKDTFSKNFGPEQYEEKLGPFVESHVSDSNEADRIIKDARIRYGTRYNYLIAQFYRKAENKEVEYDDLVDGVKETVRSGLDGVRQSVQNFLNVQTAKPKGPTVAPAQKTSWTHEIPLIGSVLKNVDIPILGIVLDSKEYRRYKEFQYKTTEQYGKFADALSAKYLGSKQHEEFLTESKKSEYKGLADEFKKGMELYAKNQLGFIFENTKDKENLREQLTALRDRIKEFYENCDANKDGVLDLHELKAAKKQTLGYLDLIRLINSEDDESILYKKLETLNFFNRESWKEATIALTDTLIADASKNGSEASFIALVKKWTGSKADMSFDKASDEFRDIMKKRAETGIKETLAAVRKFSSAVNGERAEILKLEDIKPDSIRYLVHREREMLLDRRTEPKNIDMRMVAEFMSTDLAGRYIILKDPVRRQALFQAIQNIKEHYPRIYNKEYRRSIPREIKKLVSNPDPDKPTSHDRAARLLATLTLAKEAEWVVKNLDRSEEFKGSGLYKELDNTEKEKLPPPIDMRFRDSLKLFKTGYITRASRYGFNGHDLGINALKIWAGATIFINFMNARKGGWKGVGNLMANPYMYAGVGMIYGLNKYQQNPDVKRYLFADAGEKERIVTHLRLSDLAKKTGRGPVLRFMCNRDEFRAMHELMQDPKKGVPLLKKLREKAHKRDPQNPVLAKNDLTEHLSGNIWSQLPTRENDRMRYLFYEKFLSSPRNTRTLMADCQDWNGTPGNPETRYIA